MNTNMTKEQAIQMLAAKEPVRAAEDAQTRSEAAKKGWEHRLGGYGADTPQHPGMGGGKQDDHMAEGHLFQAVQALGEAKSAKPAEKKAWEATHKAHVAAAHAFGTGNLSAHTDARTAFNQASKAHALAGTGIDHDDDARIHHEVTQTGKWSFY